MCLTGKYYYCSQELVNLLITGKAVTNVFNGVKRCGSSLVTTTTTMNDYYILKGIQKRARIGLLTLHEYHK